MAGDLPPRQDVSCDLAFGTGEPDPGRSTPATRERMTFWSPTQSNRGSRQYTNGSNAHAAPEPRSWTPAAAPAGTPQALTALGHHVDLADAAGDLLRQAATRCPRARTFHTDLCALDLGPDYQAVTCRGVLNDMIADADRDAVLRSLATSLCPGGLLFLDIREEHGSRDRADATPERQTVQLAPGTDLDFTSTVTWHAGLLHVHEQYTLRAGQEPRKSPPTTSSCAPGLRTS